MFRVTVGTAVLLRRVPSESIDNDEDMLMPAIANDDQCHGMVTARQRSSSPILFDPPIHRLLC